MDELCEDHGYLSCIDAVLDVRCLTAEFEVVSARSHHADSWDLNGLVSYFVHSPSVPLIDKRCKATGMSLSKLLVRLCLLLQVLVRCLQCPPTVLQHRQLTSKWGAVHPCTRLSQLLAVVLSYLDIIWAS